MSGGDPERRSALVTGATGGLGRELVLARVDRGWQVLAHGRDERRLAELADAAGSGVITFRADLSSLVAAGDLADHVARDHPRLDVLVNNAAVGFGPPGEGRAWSADGLELRLAVNYLVPVLLGWHLMPNLARARGRIVQIGSVGQAPLDLDDLPFDHGYHGISAYRRSKLALATYTAAAAPYFTTRVISMTLFASTVRVEVLDRTASRSHTEERFALTALVGGTTRTWTSTRRLDSGALTVDFAQEHARPPFTRMAGRWSFQPVDGGTEVVLEHHFVPAVATAETVAWIHDVVDRNSAVELAALRRVTSSPHPFDDLFVTCETVVDAAPGTDLAGFVDNAAAWPLLLPHVEAARIELDEAGAQHLSLTTTTPDGELHTTESVRLVAPGTIVYKQTTPPVGLLGHSGAWTFTTASDGRAVAVSRHLALLDPDAYADAGALAAARERFATAFAANSRVTLQAAARPVAGALG